MTAFYSSIFLFIFYLCISVSVCLLNVSFMDLVSDNKD